MFRRLVNQTPVLVKLYPQLRSVELKWLVPGRASLAIQNSMKYVEKTELKQMLKTAFESPCACRADFSGTLRERVPDKGYTETVLAPPDFVLVLGTSYELHSVMKLVTIRSSAVCDACSVVEISGVVLSTLVLTFKTVVLRWQVQNLPSRCQMYYQHAAVSYKRRRNICNRNKLADNTSRPIHIKNQVQEVY